MDYGRLERAAAQSREGEAEEGKGKGVEKAGYGKLWVFQENGCLEGETSL